MDSRFVDKIVNVVKAQGVFDQFRRECMSDCDTKPAYQNLRQRVENSVSRFLSDQKWKPEMNKNHLREKLRKHISDGRFLEIGVERIVDQVVLPKISTIFQPKIEDIVYKYLGIEKHESKYDDERLELHNNYQNGNLNIKTDLLPTEHLEEVSPDSDKSNIKPCIKQEAMEEEDDESPPFEPLVNDVSILVKPQNENSLSGLSGLASQSPADNKKDEKQINISAGDITQESQLSEVSSNSRLSIDDDEDEPLQKNEMEKPKVDICEEAQMPKFHENSNSCPPMSTDSLHFDIKKDEIKFQGTDRSSVVSPAPPPPPPPEPECLPPPPSDKTEDSYYDDDSEKALHIVEETQTKDEIDLQNNQNHVSDSNKCIAKLDATILDAQALAIEEKNSSYVEPTQKNEKIEIESASDPSFIKKMHSNNDYVDKLSNKQSEINNVESPSPIHLVDASKNITESKNKDSGSRHFASYKKHSKDKKTDKQREKEKYRSGSKYSSNATKKSNSGDKYSSHSRYSSQLPSTKDSGKDQKISNKDISSFYHHKTKNEKYSSSRNKHIRRRSTDSEEGEAKKDSPSTHKSNSSNRKTSNKNTSNSSMQETEDYSKKKANKYDDKDISGEILGNDLEKIEFVLGIRGSDNKLITEEKKTTQENEKIISIKSEANIENHINQKNVHDDTTTSKQQQLESNIETIISHKPLEYDAGYTSENEKGLKYFVITVEQENDYKTLVQAKYSLNQNNKTNESAKRKISPDYFERKYGCISSSEFTENKEKKAKTEINSDKNVEKIFATQEQEISDNVQKSDFILQNK